MQSSCQRTAADYLLDLEPVKQNHHSLLCLVHSATREGQGAVGAWEAQIDLKKCLATLCCALDQILMDRRLGKRGELGAHWGDSLTVP